jgi:hypothetical protein
MQLNNASCCRHEWLRFGVHVFQREFLGCAQDLKLIEKETLQFQRQKFTRTAIHVLVHEWAYIVTTTS